MVLLAKCCDSRVCCSIYDKEISNLDYNWVYIYCACSNFWICEDGLRILDEKQERILL